MGSPKQISPGLTAFDWALSFIVFAQAGGRTGKPSRKMLCRKSSPGSPCETLPKVCTRADFREGGKQQTTENIAPILSPKVTIRSRQPRMISRAMSRGLPTVIGNNDEGHDCLEQ